MSPPEFGSRPTALIMTGGAAFGAWQGGALQAFQKHGAEFPAVFGVSAGALNGNAWYQDKLDEMAFYWTQLKASSFMTFRPRLSPLSLFGQDRFREFLGRVAPAQPGAERGRCHFFVISADLLTGRMVQAHFPPEGSRGQDGSLLDNLLGSASVPFLFPPVAVKTPGGERLLVDGGIRCFTDLEPAFAMGCRDFLFLSIAGADKALRKKRSFRYWLGSIFEQVVEAQVENTLAVIKARNASEKEPLRAWVLAPSRHIDLDGFNFDRLKCAEAFAQGAQDGADFLKDPARFQAL